MAERSEVMEQEAVRDGAAAYSVESEIATGEDVPPGYKRTEVGVIPEDWQALPAREIGAFKGGSGFPLKAQGDNAGEYPFFKVSDMNIEGNETFMTTANHYISEETRRQLGATSFPRDSIVFAKVGAAVFLERKKILGQPSCIDNNMAAFVLDKNRSDVRYMHSLLLSKKLGDLVSTTALPALNGKQLGEMVLAVPSLSEQRAIATALSDADALIESLDRLIAKKRAIKQAAMQQLLTGQTRLPGFTGEWTTKRLGEFVSIRNQKIMPSSVHPDTPCIELEHIGQGDGRLLRSSTAKHSTASKYQFRAGDVLFGRLRSYLRKYWLAEQDGICTTEIWPLMVDPSKAVSGFLLGIVQTDRFNESASISYGTHMPRADWKVLKHFEVRLPGVKEQTAIATALSDMDTEIEALERRRDKARQIKQGMMQQLLTGRVRLVELETTG